MRLVPRGLWGRVLVGVVVLAVALVAAELGTRAVVEHRIVSLARQQMHGGSVSVGIGSTPALIDLMRGHVSHLTLDAEHVRIGNLPDVSIDATLHDLSLSGDHRVRGSDAVVTVGRSTLDALASQAAGVPGITVSPRPSEGTLVVSAISPGVVDVIAEPRLQGTRLTLVPQHVRVLGFDLNGTALQRFVARHPASQSLAGLPLSLAPSTVRVTAGGLQVVLRGGSSNLTAPAAGGGESAAGQAP